MPEAAVAIPREGVEYPADLICGGAVAFVAGMFIQPHDNIPGHHIVETVKPDIII